MEDKKNMPNIYLSETHMEFLDHEAARRSMTRSALVAMYITNTREFANFTRNKNKSTTVVEPRVEDIYAPIMISRLKDIVRKAGNADVARLAYTAHTRGLSVHADESSITRFITETLSSR